MRGYTSFLRREPIGIVGGIAPWNYPLMMAVWKLAPALAAGNVQVLKPSEQTPLTLLRFVELAAEVIPAGVLNVVTGDGVPAGEALVKHPDVRLLSLTGDVATGKVIAPARQPLRQRPAARRGAARGPAESGTAPARRASETGKRSPLAGRGGGPAAGLGAAGPAGGAEGSRSGGSWSSGKNCGPATT